MRDFILKNGKTLRIDFVSSEDAFAILEYSKMIGSESDNLTFGPDGIPLTIDQEKVFLSRFSQERLYPMFVGKIDDEIVSIANLSGSNRPRLCHNGEIGMSVIKKYWHNGVGTTMMQVLIDQAKSTKIIENIYLKVRSDNQNAIHLYESFGFKKVGTYPRQLKINLQYFDTILMALLL